MAVEGATEKKTHPQLRQAFQLVLQEQSAPAEGVGRLWRLDAQERLLQLGERTCMRVTVKLSWDQPGPYVVLEADPLEEDMGI